MEKRPFKIDEKSGRACLIETAALPVLKATRQNLLHLTEAVKESKDLPQVIFPMFHLLRAETMTRNRTWYMKAALEGKSEEGTGVFSALRPFRIPYLDEHNTYSSPIYGRMVQTFMVNNALDGKSAAAGIIGVAHPEGIMNILGGLWNTVSMGSMTENVYCGICGANLMKDDEADGCDHRPWNNEDFFARIGDPLTFMECSNARVPSDVGAQKQKNDSEVSEEYQRLFAVDANTEHVYDMADPLRANLLESAAEQARASQLWESTQWLLDEFRSARKNWFAMRESAHAQKENNMRIITPAKFFQREAMLDLPQEAFCAWYVETQSRRTFGRFPVTTEMSDEQVAYVKEQLAAAKDLSPDQVTAIAARIEAFRTDGVEVGDQVVIEITAENYTHLLDLVEESQAHASDWEVAARTAETVASEAATALTTAQEALAAAQAAGDGNTAGAGAEDTAVQAAAAAAAAAAQTTTAAEPPAQQDGTAQESVRIAELEARVEQERSARVSLLAETLARHQVLRGDSIAEGHDVASLTALYQEKSADVLQGMLDLYRDALNKPHIETQRVERVDNPADVTTTTVTTPSLQQEGAAAGSPAGESHVEEPTAPVSPLAVAGVQFGLRGYKQAEQSASRVAGANVR